MLNVRVGDFTDDCITDVRSYFCFYKQESWFADPFVRKVIEVVDDLRSLMVDCLDLVIVGVFHRIN